MNGVGDAKRMQSEGRRKPAKMGNLMSASGITAAKTGVTANKTLYKYNQLSKTNRIVNSESGGDDAIDDLVDEDGDDNDSESNNNRINSKTKLNL